MTLEYNAEDPYYHSDRVSAYWPRAAGEEKLSTAAYTSDWQPVLDQTANKVKGVPIKYSTM
jgi:hypothetical protein